MEDMMLFIPVLAAKPWVIVTLVAAVLMIAALVALSIYGKKLQDRQEKSQQELQAASQSMSLLVIDKKRMKLKESGLPQIVIEQTPKRFRGQKVPIVKAKIGPRIMSLICDEKIFDQIPLKKEVRAMVSGIYIMDVKGLRSNLEGTSKKKMSFRMRMQEKLNDLQKKARENTK